MSEEILKEKLAEHMKEFAENLQEHKEIKSMMIDVRDIIKPLEKIEQIQLLDIISEIIKMTADATQQGIEEAEKVAEKWASE